MGAADRTLVGSSYYSTLLSATSCRLSILRSFRDGIFLPPSARMRRRPGSEPSSVYDSRPARWILSPLLYRAAGFCESRQREQISCPVCAAPAPQELPELGTVITSELDLAPAPEEMPDLDVAPESHLGSLEPVSARDTITDATPAAPGGSPVLALPSLGQNCSPIANIMPPPSSKIHHPLPPGAPPAWCLNEQVSAQAH